MNVFDFFALLEKNDLCLQCITPLIQGIDHYEIHTPDCKLDLVLNENGLKLDQMEFFKTRTHTLAFTSDEALETFLKSCQENDVEWSSVKRVKLENICTSREKLEKLFSYVPHVNTILCLVSQLSTISMFQLEQLNALVIPGEEFQKYRNIYSEGSEKDFFDHLKYILFRPKFRNGFLKVLDCQNSKIMNPFDALTDGDDDLVRELVYCKSNLVSLRGVKKVTEQGFLQLFYEYFGSYYVPYASISLEDCPNITDTLFTDAKKYFCDLQSLEEIRLKKLPNLSDRGLISFFKRLKNQTENVLINVVLDRCDRLTLESIKHLSRYRLGKLKELSLRGFSKLSNELLQPIIAEKKFCSLSLREIALD